MVWAQSPPRVAASMSGRAFLGWTLATPQKYKVGRKKISNNFLAGATLVAAEYQRVTLAWLVDEVDRDREVGEDLSEPAYVVAHLLREKSRVGPCLTQDLGRGEEAVGMVEEELKQLELTLGKRHFLALDDLEVDRRRLLGRRLQIGQVAAHPIEDPALELEEIGVDAHPVARVFP